MSVSSAVVTGSSDDSTNASTPAGGSSSQASSDDDNVHDLEFITVLVQALNLILLTATELAPLRLSLKRTFTQEATADDVETFSSLFSCWLHSPVATLSLCLLAEAYDLSAALGKLIHTLTVRIIKQQSLLGLQSCSCVLYLNPLFPSENPLVISHLI